MTGKQEEKIIRTARRKKAESMQEKTAAAVKAGPAPKKAASRVKTDTKKTVSSKRGEEFINRMKKHEDELRWLYMELYDNSSMYAELCDRMKAFFDERPRDLVQIDEERLGDPDWYRGNDMLGMMFYIDNFAGTMEGVRKKLDYISRCSVNYIHLMPFLDTPRGRSDGGYAVSDFRKVQPKLGDIDQLCALTKACHKKQISVCMDFVMNHTSEDHEWAKRARAGEGEYMSRYFFYDTPDIPSRYEETVPQVFPTTAPGNFTWLPEASHFVMTTFYPYQWDLNYRNPRVFNEMMYNFLYLANCGIDIFRIDAVPYIWKEIGTSCRNLPQVHTIVRMMRLIGEIVCPGILLLGEVVMEPEKVVPYFGTVEKPECHMLYNVTTMATTWHTVATRDTRLLRGQLDIVASLPKEYVFLNYLRCHDDIGWGLDYRTLRSEGIDEVAHKKYLNDYFRGYTGSSNSRGELYNEDFVTGDARFCGTTASMCGVERAVEEQNEAMLDSALKMDIMLHAYMFMQSGIPVLYSGDEIAQLNDYSYKEDPEKADDSRYLHRGTFRWEDVRLIDQAGTRQQRMFAMLSKLEEIRRREKAFMTDADTWTIDTWEREVLCIGRYYQGEKLIGLFNFSEHDRTAWINETDGDYMDLLTGQILPARGVDIPAYGFFWLKKQG